MIRSFVSTFKDCLSFLIFTLVEKCFTDTDVRKVKVVILSKNVLPIEY